MTETKSLDVAVLTGNLRGRKFDRGNRDLIDMPANSPPLPPEQQAIQERCFHPSGTVVEFPMEDVETSIPRRFEKIVRMYPDRIAVKTEILSPHTTNSIK